MSAQTLPEPPTLFITVIFIRDPKLVALRNSRKRPIGMGSMGCKALVSELAQYIVSNGIHIGLVRGTVELFHGLLPGRFSEGKQRMIRYHVFILEE
jgi:hypothetical protein